MHIVPKAPNVTAPRNSPAKKTPIVVATNFKVIETNLTTNTEAKASFRPILSAVQAAQTAPAAPLSCQPNER